MNPFLMDLVGSAHHDCEETRDAMIANYTDHAANERTFLAWIRTGLAVTAFGFFLVKLNLLVAVAGDGSSPHLPVEGGGPLPRFFMTLNGAFGLSEKSGSPTASPPSLAQLFVTTAPGFTRGPMQVNINLQPDGTFKTSLPQGQYQIAAMIPMYGSGPRAHTS